MELADQIHRIQY